MSPSIVSVSELRAASVRFLRHSQREVVRLGGRWHALSAAERWASAGALIAVCIFLGWVIAADHSRVLTPQEVGRVHVWVLATQDAAVLESFVAHTQDRKLTERGVAQIAEVAKAARIPDGLYRPVDLDD